MPIYLMMSKVVIRGETEGIEPSKYLKEKKSNEIPGVVANETGGAQTMEACFCGVEGLRD